MQLVREAPRGLREDLVLLLFSFIAFPLLARDRSRRGAITIALAIGVLSVIRWEVATLALATCVLFAVFKRGPALAPVLAALLVVALSGPWLLANRARHGDLLYQTKVHSTFYWKLEQPQSVRRQYVSPPGVDPPVHLSWSQYYLDELGPADDRQADRGGLPAPARQARRLAGRPAQGGDVHARKQPERGALVRDARRARHARLGSRCLRRRPAAQAPPGRIRPSSPGSSCSA